MIIMFIIIFIIMKVIKNKQYHGIFKNIHTKHNFKHCHLSLIMYSKIKKQSQKNKQQVFSRWTLLSPPSSITAAPTPPLKTTTQTMTARSQRPRRRGPS